MLGRDRSVTGATNHTADSFAAFFAKKTDDVRTATAGMPSPDDTIRASSSMSSFQLCSQVQARRIVMSSPVKSGSLNPIPTFILREFIHLLLPYLTSMVVASLVQGRLPTSEKHVIVTPPLKKTGLDTSDMSNYRPVSNLNFILKIVERAVAMQWNDYLTSHSLLPRCQSAYRKKYSTETAMLRVLSDFLTAADGRKITLLGLLDISAAFDCVDHVILLRRLELGFSLTDDIINWIRSFLTGRTQRDLVENPARVLRRTPGFCLRLIYR
jgi:Reverse transcriptase (RNA-dependent DNA polymerase)